MAKKKKKSKLGAGAIFARILVIVLVTAIGGVAGFFGFKTYFSNKFKKDKKAEIAKQLKEESKEKVDVGMIQTGNSIVIRIYHNKNQEMIFVPLRQDMTLKLTKSGKKAIEKTLGSNVSKATVADVIKATKNDGNLMKEQVEKTLGISINSYELLSRSKFVNLMNKSGDIKVEFDEAMSYTDSTDKYVTLSEGENSLNGTAVYSLISESGIFEDKNQQAELTGEICVAIASALNNKSLSEYKEYAQNYFDAVKSDVNYEDVESYLSRIRDIEDKNLNFKVLDGTESNGQFVLDTTEAKRVFDEMLSEDGDLTSALKSSTTAKKTTTTKSSSSSKNISIEIQNSTSISGLAGRWKDKLTTDGYLVGSVKTYREGVLTHTKIIVQNKSLGKDLKSYFKNPEYEVGTVNSGAKICIIVGTEDEI